MTIVSVRAIERTALPRPADGLAWHAATSADRRPPARTRSPATSGCDFAVIDRERLQPRRRTFAGPAIVLEKTATTYLDIGMEGVVHSSGALVVTDTNL